jgi:hypothetical protein
MADRHVHIRLPDGREVVRYNRAGKWYMERPGGCRHHLKLADAASWAHHPGAEVFTGLPGGNAFDRMVQRRG